MDEKTKELIRGWHSESDDERALDIEKFLERIMSENSEAINSQCERKIKSMVISAEVRIDEIKRTVPKTVDKFKFNKPIKGKLKRIIRKIRRLDRKKKKLMRFTVKK